MEVSAGGREDPWAAGPTGPRVLPAAPSPWVRVGSSTCGVVEHAVRVDGGLVGRRRVIRLVDVRVLVRSVGRRGVMEVESASLSIIREVQWREARAEPIWAIIKARDPPAKVEVVH